ncbi:14756_t:CDS:1, partial [Racocetra fulgida]
HSLNFAEAVTQIQKSPPSITTTEPLTSQFNNPDLNPQEAHEDSPPLNTHTNQPTTFVNPDHPTIHTSHASPAQDTIPDPKKHQLRTLRPAKK